MPPAAAGRMGPGARVVGQAGRARNDVRALACAESSPTGRNGMTAGLGGEGNPRRQAVKPGDEVSDEFGAVSVSGQFRAAKAGRAHEGLGGSAPGGSPVSVVSDSAEQSGVKQSRQDAVSAGAKVVGQQPEAGGT